MTFSRAVVEALVRRFAAHLAVRVVTAMAGEGPEPRAAVSTRATATTRATRAGRVRITGSGLTDAEVAAGSGERLVDMVD